MRRHGAPHVRDARMSSELHEEIERGERGGRVHRAVLRLRAWSERHPVLRVLHKATVIVLGVIGMNMEDTPTTREPSPRMPFSASSAFRARPFRYPMARPCWSMRSRFRKKVWLPRVEL